MGDWHKLNGTLQDLKMDESVKNFNWVVSVPIGLTICAIGIVGNLISIRVWNGLSRQLRTISSSASMYLITLSVCDLGFLIFYILAESLPNAAIEVKSNYSYAAFYSWVAYPMMNYFFNAGVWLVVGVTTNRYILTYYPLKGKVLCSKVRTRLGIASILILAACVNVPHFWNYHPLEVGVGEYRLTKTEYGDSFHARMFHFWVHCIILSIVPWFVLALLNFLIIQKLKKQTIKFTSIRSRTKSEDADRRITSMFLGITFSFLVLMGLQCVTQCLHKQKYRIDEPHYWHRVQKGFTVGRLALAINASINCFFYCFSGITFRREVKRMFSKSNSVSRTISSNVSHARSENRSTKRITSSV